jgi:hypothetical protein
MDQAASLHHREQQVKKKECERMNGLCLDRHEKLRKIITYISVSRHCKGQHQRL